MVEISENLKVGDIVYVSVSPIKEKSKIKGKPLDESAEYKITNIGANGSITLISTSGEYSIYLGKDSIEQFFGYIRK